MKDQPVIERPARRPVVEVDRAFGKAYEIGYCQRRFLELEGDENGTFCCFYLSVQPVRQGLGKTALREQAKNGEEYRCQDLVIKYFHWCPHLSL